MRTFPLLAIIVLTTGCAGSRATRRATESEPTIKLASELEWEQLNPARGDQSPQAAALWGDRKGPGPSGFLVRFVDGFSSPPHIHNVSYRGVVIDGLLHNDDPNAEAMWMPKGSFWTQPKGDPHITAARGNHALAYIEIEEGPYLVRPIEEAFRSEETPANEDSSDMAWSSWSETIRNGLLDAQAAADGTQTLFLWGERQDEGPRGLLVKLRGRSSGVLRGDGSPFRAVVIQGSPRHQPAGTADSTVLPPGSYIGATGTSERISCESARDCILYVRMAP